VGDIDLALLQDKFDFLPVLEVAAVADLEDLKARSQVVGLVLGGGGDGERALLVGSIIRSNNAYAQ
jgi:hypothetical protein